MLEELEEVSYGFEQPISMKYILDFRGRIYPMYTPLSYISHSFIRRLFSLTPSEASNEEQLVCRERTLRVLNNILDTDFADIEDVREYVEGKSVESLKLDCDAF